jgi:hypothetical protein
LILIEPHPGHQSRCTLPSHCPFGRASYTSSTAHIWLVRRTELWEAPPYFLILTFSV